MYYLCVCVFAGVQILHVSGNNWVCASRIAGSVEVCDSLYSQIDGDLQLQLARLYRMTDCVRDGGFVVVRKGVQRQLGTADCGVFAIAAAFHTASREDVTTLNFLQQQMRQHLTQCFEQQKLSPFPLEACKRGRRRQDQNVTVQLYCTCNMPESFDVNMIMCDVCLSWFHFSCVNLSKEPNCWTCSNCCT